MNGIDKPMPFGNEGNDSDNDKSLFAFNEIVKMTSFFEKIHIFQND